MIHKWYRGHDGNQKATDNFGIIWVTDDPEYAQLYADEYRNEGVVSVLYIDESKLNYADTYYDDDFDVWFPDMAKVKEYQKEGYNCYSFPVSIDGLDCDCIALFDESAIVKIEQMNKNKGNMNSRVKLTETELKKIIAESVKKVLSEIGDTPRGQYALGAVKGKVSENTDNDIAWQEFVNEQKNVLEQLMKIFQRSGINSAELTTYRTGLPVIAINTDEWNNSNAHEIARKFAESKGMYVSDQWYPATTYIKLEKLK